MTRVRERVVNVWVPVPIGGGRFGGVGAMFALFAAVLAVAVLVLLVVVAAYPSPQYSPVPTTYELGPCDPFCAPRATVTAPIGGEPR
ncbi:hypothetical protein [Nocardia sp. CC216A]|uniref:hypothetical protein n=1 Tax=Nocardia sp. CC216A TaxID=3044158 RepID=UPI002795740E|nr:hypothetical protein [Nocardia sp. CC216A]